VHVKNRTGKQDTDISVGNIGQMLGAGLKAQREAVFFVAAKENEFGHYFASVLNGRASKSAIIWSIVCSPRTSFATAAQIGISIPA
jgi:hypothetical protein